jgi:hypothetical protein
VGWQDKNYDYQWLRFRAGLEHPERDVSSVGWLIDLKVIPDNASAYAALGRPPTPPDPKHISASYLVKFARDFDKDGPSTPVEFCNALAFEIPGTKERKIFSEIMNEGTE